MATQLRVSCLREAKEHRALVVGEMPDDGHFPAAFVSPEDMPGTWFMQGQPLVEGRAFAALVCFGNPGLIGHGWPELSSYRLRVIVRRAPWRLEPRASVTDAELTELARGAVVWPEPDVHPMDVGRVERTSPLIRSICVDMPGNAPQSLTLPARFVGHSTALITWKGVGDVHVQVRTAKRDQRVWAGRVTTGELLLKMAGARITSPNSNTAIELPGDHRQFRVQFYAKPRLVLDPIAELWLDFDATSEQASVA